LDIERDLLFLGIEGKPTGSYLVIGPGGGEIGAEAEDVMEMGIHDGVGADIDGEDGSEELESTDNQSFTVREIASCDGVTAAEERTSDAAGVAMINAFFTIPDIFASRKSHRSPPFYISNEQLRI